MGFDKLSIDEEEIGKAIVNSVYKVHKELGRDCWKECTKFALLTN